MKMDKAFMKQMLIILLVVFIIVPIILMLFGMNGSVQEGFYTFDDDDKTSAEMKIKALDITGLDISSGSSGGQAVEGEHRIKNQNNHKQRNMFCVFGDISCAPGYTASMELVDIGGVQTEKYKCISDVDGTHDPTQAICNGGLFETATYKTFYDLDASNCWKNDASGYNFGSVKYLHGGTEEISGNLDNFTSIYWNKLPFVMTDENGIVTSGSDANKVKFNLQADTIGFTFQGNDLLSSANDLDYSTCYFYNSNADCQIKGKCPDALPKSETESGDESESKSQSESSTITCNAHYGDKIGDSLCCGQTGVVQNDSRVCPYEYPTCSGYKCGEKWGTCS
jgi:hypothetical protein